MSDGSVVSVRELLLACHGNAELWNTRYTSCNMLCKANVSFFVKTLNYVVKCCIVSYTCIVFNECKNRRVSASLVTCFT